MLAGNGVQSFDYYKHFDRTFVKKMAEVSTVMPIHFRSGHLCMGSGASVIGFLMPVYFALLPQSYRYRLVLHSGTDTENLSSMSTYGVKSESVPERLGGCFSDDEFREWLDKQRCEENEKEK